MSKKRTPHGVALNWLLELVSYEGDDCKIWPFAKLRAGYGTVDWQGKTVTAHRLICRLKHGEPERGKIAAHRCGNPSCINPNHLRWATYAENDADKLIHDTHIRGERNHESKLTRHDVTAMRRAYDSGRASLIDLYQRYGVSKSTAYRILMRQSWTWLK